MGKPWGRNLHQSHIHGNMCLHQNMYLKISLPSEQVLGILAILLAKRTSFLMHLPKCCKGLSFVVQSTWLLLSKGHSAPFVGCARQRPLRCHLKQLPRYSLLISTSSLGLCLCVCHPKTCPNPPNPHFSYRNQSSRVPTGDQIGDRHSWSAMTTWGCS